MEEWDRSYGHRERRHRLAEGLRGCRPAAGTTDSKWLPASGRHYRFKVPRRPSRFALLFPCAPANCRGSARVGWRDPEPHGCGDGAYKGEGALLARHCLASARTPSRQRLGRAAERDLQRVPPTHPRRPSQTNVQSRRLGSGSGRVRDLWWSGSGSRTWLGSTPARPDRHRSPKTTKARPRPGFCCPPSGIPKDPTPGAMDQRLENWVARRALCRPTFLRSTSRASRVMKPALRSSDFRVSSYSTSARAMPRRIAPA